MAAHRGMGSSPAAVRITTNLANLAPADAYRRVVSHGGQDYDQLWVLWR